MTALILRGCLGPLWCIVFERGGQPSRSIEVRFMRTKTLRSQLGKLQIARILLTTRGGWNYRESWEHVPFNPAYAPPACAGCNRTIRVCVNQMRAK